MKPNKLVVFILRIAINSSTYIIFSPGGTECLNTRSAYPAVCGIYRDADLNNL